MQSDSLMPKLMSNPFNIALVGLPGAGKSRVLNSTQTHPMFMTRHGQVFELNRFVDASVAGLPAVDWRIPTQIWCVLDVRKPLLAGRDEAVEQALLQLLSQAHGVVLTFLEDADLTQQAWWNHWLKQHVAALPVVRWLSHAFPAGWLGFELNHSFTHFFTSDSGLSVTTPGAWQRFEFELDRVCLDHLLMGLDASKTNLGMAIWRVHGVVNTLEYQNSIAIEGTPTHIRTYAADTPKESPDNAPTSEQKIGRLVIEGFGLDQAWLTQIVMASAV